MPQRPADKSDEEHLRGAVSRNGQYWVLVAIGLVSIGIAGAIYDLLRIPSGWSPELARQLVPPLMFGIVSLLVLFAFYLAQKQSMVRALHQALVKQKIEAELNRELSLLDPITEVYNRRYLRTILRREVERAKRHNFKLAVMLVDVVGFRRVNESLGQTGGDVVLKEIAHLIQTRVRNSDAVVRFGGDDFLLVLSDTDDSGVQKLSHRLKEAMTDWGRKSSMTEFELGFAIGTAPYLHDRPLDQMLGVAEQRMLQDLHAQKTSRKESPPGSKSAAVAIS